MRFFSKIKEGKNYNHSNTLKYFEDYHVSLTQRLGKRGRFEMDSIKRVLLVQARKA
jgi:hypothetical protein